MIGQTISHYRILEKIGEGGMGVVYKAQDLRLDRLVALKFLPPHLQANEETRKRFIHEAKAASALDHPNIITVHEIDHTPDGRMFIATAYYEGESLSDRLSRGPMALGDALEILSQIAKGLGKAHEKKIIHRDIKPPNILITRDNLVKIVDFGLAKLAGQTKVTKTGSTVGTVSYMSPEQARGEEVDHRSDIFSLGSVFYEMLTGERPFPGDHEAAVLYAIVNEDPLPLARQRSDLPGELQPLVSKMLAKDLEKRYGTLGEVLNDVAGLQVGAPVVPAERSRRGSRRGRTVAAVAAVLLVAAAGLWLWRSYGPASPRGLGYLPDVPGEFTIAVAPFWGIDEEARSEGKVMQTLVERRLRDIIGSEERVRIIAQSIDATPRTPDDARELGAKMDASIVLWGEVLTLRGEVEIQPAFAWVAPPSAWSARELGGKHLEGMERNLVVDLSVPDQFELRRAKADEIGRFAALAAARFYRKRNPERAVEIIDGVVPPMAEAEQLRAVIFADDRRWDQAKAAYETALRLAPESPWPLVGLAWVQAQLKEYDTAISTYRKAIERDPENAQAYCYLGGVYAETGDYDAAMREFRRAEKIAPRSVGPHLSIGNMYIGQQRYADAIKAYQKAAEIDPSDPRPHVNLATAYMYSSKPKEKMRECEKAVALAPDDVIALSQLASCFVEAGRYDGAVVLLRRCLALEPSDVGHRIALAGAYERQGKLDLAKKELEQAITLKPREPGPHEALAYFCENRGDTSTAIDEYKRAIELQTEGPVFSAWVRLGGIYLGRGRVDEAEAAFRQAAVGEDGGFVDFFVGNQFLFRGHYERALEVYRNVVAQSPDWEHPYLYMGMTYERMGRLQEATVGYAKAVALTDSAGAVYFSLRYGVALYRMGRAQEALARMGALSDSLHGVPSDGPSRYDANIVDFLAGRISEKELWKAARSDNELEERCTRIVASYYIGMAYLVGMPLRLTRQAPDEEKAREYFEKALAIKVPDAAAPEEREWAEFELGRLRSR